jgi:hypothetical protein
MATTDVFEKARTRHRELSRIIQAADDVRVEWTQLQEFLAMAQKLFPNDIGDGAGDTVGAPPEHPAVNGQPVVTIADRAEQILRKRGRLHMKELFREMRAAGWKATGEDGNDVKNLRNTMSNRPKKFKNVGNNTWEMVQN